MTKPKRGQKAKFFGFPVDKQWARILYIGGVLLLIFTSISAMWLIYSALVVSAAYTQWGVSGYYAGSFMYYIPWLVVEVALMILAVYMILVGRKGK